MVRQEMARYRALQQCEYNLSAEILFWRRDLQRSTRGARGHLFLFASTFFSAQCSQVLRSSALVENHARRTPAQIMRARDVTITRRSSHL